MLLAALVACALPAASQGAVTGALKRVGCVQDAAVLPIPAGCTGVTALSGLGQLAVSPNGLSLYAPGRISDSLAVFSRNATTGALTELQCFAAVPAGPTASCTGAPGLQNAIASAVTPDGTGVYVVGLSARTIVAFTRSTTNGTLTWAGCVQGTGGPPIAECATGGEGMSAPVALAISPDNGNVYVASYDSSTVAAWVRDPATGALTQSPDSSTDYCIAGVGGNPDGCSRSTTLLAGPRDIVVSPDGRQVYVGGDSPAQDVLAFNRQTDETSNTFGELSPRSDVGKCVSQTGSGGQCHVMSRLASVSQLAFGPGGSLLYTTSRNGFGIVALDRNTSTGAISFHPGGCVAYIATAECKLGSAMTEPFDVVATPDGHNVYAGMLGGADPVGAGALDSFATAAGTLTQLPSPFGCLKNLGSAVCGGDGLSFAPESLVLSPNGRTLYSTVGVASGARILVWAVDRPPTCKAVSATTKFNTPVTITLSCSDPDGDATPIAVTRLPSNGNLGSLQAGNKIAYSPFNTFSGRETFYYHAVAAGVAADNVAVTIDVAARPKPKPRRITSPVKGAWLFYKTGTRVGSLRITAIPTGAVVQVRCKGKGCPFKKKKVKFKNGRANVASLFKKKHLRRGVVVEIRITAPGRIGEVRRLTMRNPTKLQVPSDTTLCLPPGATKPRKTC